MLRSPSLPSALAAILVLLLSACDGGTDAAPGEVAGSDDNEAGYSLYRRGACHTCHGPELAGSQLGPPLAGLATHWDVDGLVELMLDPAGVVALTPRLRERAGMYIMKMPPATQSGLSRDQIRELATWLLAEDRVP